jgi:carboxypeptidase Taq
MASSNDLYEQLTNVLRAHADLAAAIRLLQWDQETYMPAGVAEIRARHIGTLAAALHERRTAAPFLDLVDELFARRSTLEPWQLIDVRETKWRTDRQRALDTALVRERSVLHAGARAVWVDARANDDFAALAPYLERIVETERRVATCIDADRDAYEVLLEGYEPGMTVARLDACFAEVRAGLQPLVEALSEMPPRGSATALEGDFPVDRQRALNHRLLEEVGFDFNRGRLDVAAHPFSMSIGGDVRLTTRYDAGDLRYSLYSTIHEAGHGLYEQGLDRGAWGLPRGEACSLGVHESQSRFWENNVGRSAGFWQRFLPVAAESFPGLSAVSLGDVLYSANQATPSLIRTESDEITYNLHIVLRYELERALISGALEARELPAAWRESMSRSLDVMPRNDRDGVLQDVHWASGAIGYFPTYTLGNVYAAELAAAVERLIAPLDELLARGEFDVLLDWLRRKIHQRGQALRGHELIAEAIGREPTPAALVSHLAERLQLLRDS